MGLERKTSFAVLGGIKSVVAWEYREVISNGTAPIFARFIARGTCTFSVEDVSATMASDGDAVRF